MQRTTLMLGFAMATQLACGMAMAVCPISGFLCIGSDRLAADNDNKSLGRNPPSARS